MLLASEDIKQKQNERKMYMFRPIPFNFFNELCIHECMTELQAPGLQFACFYFRQCFNRSNCKYIHF